MLKKLLAGILFALSVPVFGEVAHSAKDGFELKAAVSVPATPEQAYNQFLQIDKWWSPDHTYWGKSENLSLDTYACLLYTSPSPRDA